MELTQARLKEVIDYNCETGIFTWINKPSKMANSSIVGSVAGGSDGIGYIRIRIDGKKHKAHRLAFLYMRGVFPLGHVDHGNHVRDDNRWCNLSDIKPNENCHNRKLNTNNKSGFCGVRWNKKAGKWGASVAFNGQSTFLGLFDDIGDAIQARVKANIELGFHENHGMGGC